MIRQRIEQRARQIAEQRQASGWWRRFRTWLAGVDPEVQRRLEVRKAAQTRANESFDKTGLDPRDRLPGGRFPARPQSDYWSRSRDRLEGIE